MLSFVNLLAKDQSITTPKHNLCILVTEMSRYEHVDRTKAGTFFVLERLIIICEISIIFAIPSINFVDHGSESI